MTSSADFERPTKCTRCGEELIASVWSAAVSIEETRNFWCCSKCGNMFETIDQSPTEELLSTELIEKFLPALLVA
jgi:transcription elongation factor Elf1